MNKIIKAGFTMGALLAIGAVAGYECNKHHDEINKGISKMSEVGKRKTNEIVGDIKQAMDDIRNKNEQEEFVEVPVDEDENQEIELEAEEPAEADPAVENEDPDLEEKLEKVFEENQTTDGENAE